MAKKLLYKVRCVIVEIFTEIQQDSIWQKYCNSPTEQNVTIMTMHDI